MEHREVEGTMIRAAGSLPAGKGLGRSISLSPRIQKKRASESAAVPSGSEGEGVVIFFQDGPAVKRTTFRGSSLPELWSLFASLFDSGSGTPAEEGKPQFRIIDCDSGAKENVISVKQLYQFAIVERIHHRRPLPAVYRPASGLVGAMTGNSKCLIAMVGLPARGKTFIAKKVARYLNWLSIPCEVFSVADYRRREVGAMKDADFFNPKNENAAALRAQMASKALVDAVAFLRDGGGLVSVLDASNVTTKRRSDIESICKTEGNISVLFIESFCTDPRIIEYNIEETELNMPDYRGMPREEMLRDFQRRIEFYQSDYQSLGDEDKSCFIKIINMGERVITQKVESYLERRIAFFVTHLHTTKRQLWFTRHGESQFNVMGLIGGDSSLSDRGQEYAVKLNAWVEETHGGASQELVVWTSTLRRTISTAERLPALKKFQIPALDEIDAGICDSKTYKMIAQEMPEEFAARAGDKLRYRYPQGESYMDLVQRLEPVIFELERARDPILVVGHQAVLRVLVAYFEGQRPEDIPHIQVPLHTLLQVTPRAYRCDVVRIKLMESREGDD